MRNNSEHTDDSVDFVASHWKEGAFDERKARIAAGIPVRLFPWRAVVAVSVGVIMAAGAVAAFIGVGLWQDRKPVENVGVESPAVIGEPISAETIQHIEFEDAPLADVVDEVESVYGVRIGNEPSGDYRLTLSYDGSAAELVDVINELLCINLVIEE